ncbi:MAG: putative porin [Candidatus Udaeobacter sp.]
MFIKRFILRTAGASLAATICLAAQSLAAQTSSESKAIEDLKRQVAELQKEVTSLKQHPGPGDGPMTTEVVHDGKTYVERSVPVEKSAADKWKLSTSLTELEIFGDIRLRYQYNGGETKNTGPVGAPGAGVAGVNDWQERERERYRIRLGLRGTLMDDWFFGVRLETNNNARSTNVTFGDDTASSTPGGGGPFEKNSDTIYVGQAYAGYKGFPDFTFTAGRMANPLLNTRMLWDVDINPEGLAEQWKHTWAIGGGAPSPPIYSKDGKDAKAVVEPHPPEPWLNITAFANFAQFVYDDTNPENPLGARATTTSNNGSNQLVPNTDAFLCAWQIGAKFDFPHIVYFQLAPTLYNYTGNGDTFNIHYQGGDPRLTNSASLAENQTGINSLLVFDMPVEIGWKVWGLPMRAYGDFATNFEGNERASAAGQPGQGSQRYAYQAGLGIGQLKAKNDWQLDVWYQHQEQYALDPNLIDDDFFNAQLNVQGIGVTAAYNLTAAVNFTLNYGHAWWYNHNLGTGGNPGSLAIATNPTNEYNFFTADLNVKF